MIQFHSTSTIPIAERFWSKVDRSGACWEWQGARYPTGYGHFYVESGPRGRRYDYAHRVSYELSFGPIPKGLFVCHHCDNPPCVRPEHLFLGTAADNVHDRDAKGRTAAGERTRARHVSERIRRGSQHPSHRLTEPEVRTIRARLAAGDGIRPLAREYGVKENAIWKIKHGRSWSWLS